MSIAILTSPNQWFVPYAKELQNKISNSALFFDHKNIQESFKFVFILSYHRIIPEIFLKKHDLNIVIHASDLPKGKGWAPMFWQVLEGKNKIIFSMFEVTPEVDAGDVFMKKILQLDGSELNEELRNKQAHFTLKMVLEFIENPKKHLPPKKQAGAESFYKKRGPKDSELDINKSIKEQFNLLRTVHNKDYPAFFEMNGVRYKIQIEKMDAA